MINFSSVKPNWQQDSISNVHLLPLLPYFSGLEHNEVLVDFLSKCHPSYFITFKLACIFQWKSPLSPEILTAFPVKLSLQVIPPKNMWLSSDRGLQCSYECNEVFNQDLQEARQNVYLKSQSILQPTSIRYRNCHKIFLSQAQQATC
jgi:hypothetical protein